MPKNRRLIFSKNHFWKKKNIEDINPCGGEQYSKKALIEAEAASPEAYVKENRRFPILETTSNENGDVVIVTGDNNGSFVRYTFTE